MTDPTLNYAPPPTHTPSRAALITGWILSAFPILMLGVLPIFMFFNLAEVTKGLKHYGFPEGIEIPLLLTEIACALLFAIPQTATLGAILITGYLGGAVATHVHAGESNFWLPPIFAVLAWAGLLLRDPHLRQILPFRKPTKAKP